MAYIDIPPTSGGIDPWYTQRQSLMKSQVPSLTRFVPIYLGVQQSAFNAGLTDPALEGAGVSNVSGSAIFDSQGSLFQTMKTGKWALGFRAKFAAQAGGQVSRFGTCNTGAGHVVAFGTDNALDTTHYVLNITGGATTSVVTTLVSDTNLHDVVLTFDATTLKIFIDGAQVGSTATTTNLVDEPHFLYSHGTASGRVSTTMCMYGFVAP